MLADDGCLDCEEIRGYVENLETGLNSPWQTEVSLYNAG